MLQPRCSLCGGIVPVDTVDRYHIGLLKSQQKWMFRQTGPAPGSEDIEKTHLTFEMLATQAMFQTWQCWQGKRGRWLINKYIR